MTDGTEQTPLFEGYEVTEPTWNYLRNPKKQNSCDFSGDINCITKQISTTILVFGCFHSTYQKLTKIFLFHSKKNLLSFCSHLGHGSVQFISYTKKERKPCK